MRLRPPPEATLLSLFYESLHVAASGGRSRHSSAIICPRERGCVRPRVVSRDIAPAEFEGHAAALPGCGDNVTMPNRPSLAAGRSMTFPRHRRGTYIV